MVINYKQINDAMEGDAYFLPRKDLIIERVRNMNWFSTFDCKSGFYQIRLTEESKALTACSCPQGQYEWNVLPMGMKQSPGIFQRRMDTILKEFKDFCLIYIDDILVFSNKDLDDHFNKVELVLNKCFEHGVVLSKKKVVIAQNKINYLGLEIEKGKIIMQKHVLEKLQNFPTKLKDKKELQRFLGLLTYISNEGFIKNLAAERKLLQQKLKKDSIWSWTEEDEVLITKLKNLCQDLSELYHPCDDDLIIIRCQMKLAEYNYSISHIKGEKNVLADILSREWNEAKNY